MSFTNITSIKESIDCATFTDQDDYLLNVFSFWVEGVLQTITAIFGIFGNIIASIIVTRKDMRNSFKLHLAACSACYLLSLHC